MAEIPVERKSSLAWLWILLGLLLLALLAWWLLSDDDEGDLVANETEEVAPLVDEDELDDVAETGAITDLSELTDLNNLDPLVGRTVDFDSVSVESVTDDMGFWIGDGPDNRAFVSFVEYPTPNKPNLEGHVDVNKPSLVSLEGEIVSNTGEPAPNIEVTLPDVTSYIRATKVEVIGSE